jgi:hypothetical protein
MTDFMVLGCNGFFFLFFSVMKRKGEEEEGGRREREPYKLSRSHVL